MMMLVDQVSSLNIPSQDPLAPLSPHLVHDIPFHDHDQGRASTRQVNLELLEMSVLM